MGRRGDGEERGGEEGGGEEGGGEEGGGEEGGGDESSGTHRNTHTHTHTQTSVLFLRLKRSESCPIRHTVHLLSIQSGGVGGCAPLARGLRAHGLCQGGLATMSRARSVPRCSPAPSVLLGW